MAGMSMASAQSQSRRSSFLGSLEFLLVSIYRKQDIRGEA